MTEDIQKYTLFIKNSKIFLGRILKRDSKTRNVELELNNQKKTICKINDLILEVSLANSSTTNNNIELSDLWSDLSNKTQIISTNEFIKIITESDTIYGEGLVSDQNFSKYTIKNIKGSMAFDTSYE